MKIPELILATKRKMALPEQVVKEVVSESLNGFGMLPPEQGRKNWCWAVVAEAVTLFYPSTPNTSQCDLAKVRYGDNCCSEYGDCDGVWELDLALQYTGNHLSGPHSTPTLFSDIVDATHRQQPVCCRLKTNSGHVVTIIGIYSDGTNKMLSIMDPDGPTTWPSEFNDFVYNQRSDTYFTIG